MCYVERIIKQLRRHDVVKIVTQLTEYYEEYGDYAGECDVTVTHEMTDSGWISTMYYHNEGDQPEPEEHASYDDVIDDIIEYLYRDPYSVSSIKTYVDGDTVGVDVNF